MCTKLKTSLILGLLMGCLTQAFATEDDNQQEYLSKPNEILAKQGNSFSNPNPWPILLFFRALNTESIPEDPDEIPSEHPTPVQFLYNIAFIPPGATLSVGDLTSGEQPILFLPTIGIASPIQTSNQALYNVILVPGFLPTETLLLASAQQTHWAVQISSLTATVNAFFDGTFQDMGLSTDSLNWNMVPTGEESTTTPVDTPLATQPIAHNRLLHQYGEYVGSFRASRSQIRNTGNRPFRLLHPILGRGDGVAITVHPGNIVYASDWQPLTVTAISFCSHCNEPGEEPQWSEWASLLLPRNLVSNGDISGSDDSMAVIEIAIPDHHDPATTGTSIDTINDPLQGGGVFERLYIEFTDPDNSEGNTATITIKSVDLAFPIGLIPLTPRMGDWVNLGGNADEPAYQYTPSQWEQLCQAYSSNGASSSTEAPPSPPPFPNFCLFHDGSGTTPPTSNLMPLAPFNNVNYHDDAFVFPQAITLNPQIPLTHGGLSQFHISAQGLTQVQVVSSDEPNTAAASSNWPVVQLDEHGNLAGLNAPGVDVLQHPAANTTGQVFLCQYNPTEQLLNGGDSLPSEWPGCLSEVTHLNTSSGAENQTGSGSGGICAEQEPGTEAPINPHACNDGIHNDDYQMEPVPRPTNSGDGPRSPRGGRG